MRTLLITTAQVLTATLVLFLAQDGRFLRDGVFLFEPASHAAWQSAMADWQGRSDMAVQSRYGNASAGGAIAQSFVPHRATVEAVQLRITLSMVPRGWARVELAEDDEGQPGRVLARSWVRLEDKVPLVSGDYLAVPLRSEPVDPDATHWITFVECRDRGFKHTYLASVLGSPDDLYREGRLLLPDGTSSAGAADADFRVAATAPAVPGLQDVSVIMQNALPPGDCRTASWRKAFEECNRTGPAASGKLPAMR